MIDQRPVYVDLTKCKHVGMLHPLIKEAFRFPDGYGLNWSAFQDWLSYDYPVARVVVTGASTLPPIFDDDMRIFKEILEETLVVSKRQGWEFSYEFS